MSSRSAIFKGPLHAVFPPQTGVLAIPKANLLEDRKLLAAIPDMSWRLSMIILRPPGMDHISNMRLDASCSPISFAESAAADVLSFWDSDVAGLKIYRPDSIPIFVQQRI
jgi:hypothetical protein